MSITNPNHLCINCMREKPTASVCPFCGFDEAQYEPSPHHLPSRSILNGKYLIGRVLGEGGFGITYIGWDLNLDLKLAIKEYYPTGFVTRTSAATSTVMPYRGEKEEFFSKGRERFIQEAKTIAKFYALPGIVSVRDFFLENGTAYIAMEFVEGETLKQRLARVGGKMDAQEVLHLVRPLLRSLAEMHASGLIHRDISPDNIMITPEDNIKLIDFGAARDYLDSGNKSLSVMLKPGFAPEEQYFARGQQGPWTDIYALSATIYRAITGVTPPEAVERRMNDELKAPSTLGVRLTHAQEAALLKGLHIAQASRWQAVPEFYAALYQDSGSTLEKLPLSRERARRSAPFSSSGLSQISDWGKRVFSRRKSPGAIAPAIKWVIFAGIILVGGVTLAVTISNKTQADKLAQQAQKLSAIEYAFDTNSDQAVPQLWALYASEPASAIKLIQSYRSEIHQYANAKRATDEEESEKAYSMFHASYMSDGDFSLFEEASNRLANKAFHWRWGNTRDQDYILAQKLVGLTNYQCVGDLLMKQHQTAVQFFMGRWSDGSNVFELEQIAGKTGKFSADTNIADIDIVSWYIEDGCIYTKPTKKSKMKLATITVLDQNTILFRPASQTLDFRLQRE